MAVLADEYATTHKKNRYKHNVDMHASSNRSRNLTAEKSGGVNAIGGSTPRSYDRPMSGRGNRPIVCFTCKKRAIWRPAANLGKIREK